MRELFLSLGAMALGFLIGRSLIEKAAPAKPDASAWQAEMLKTMAAMAHRTMAYIAEDAEASILKA